MNKEEIEERITYAKSKFWEIKHREPTEGIEILLEIIEQLKNKVKEQEESKQAVKDKLKEDIRIFQQKLEEANTKLDKLHYAKRIEYAREILNMLEGEKK